MSIICKFHCRLQNSVSETQTGLKLRLDCFGLTVSTVLSLLLPCQFPVQHLQWIGLVRQGGRIQDWASCLPGPTQRTVLEPGAIWVLPASLTTCVFRLSRAASAATFRLAGTTHRNTDIYSLNSATHKVCSSGAFTTTFMYPEFSHLRSSYIH